MICPRRLNFRANKGILPGLKTPSGFRGRLIRIGSASESDKNNADETQVVSTEGQKLSETTAQVLKDKVFSLDTFFVQSSESYGDNGVLFKGNIRQNPSKVQAILQERLLNHMQGYKIFIMQDRQDKPTAVVIPESTMGAQNSNNELILSIFLGMATVFTTLNVYDAEIFNAALLVFNVDSNKIIAAIPASLASSLILAAHELGHFIASKRYSVPLAPPLLLPAGLGLLGSFGSITRIKGDIQNRQVLADIVAPGPIFGLTASFITLIIGLFLTLNHQGGVDLDSASFRDSLFVGAITNFFLGDRVFNVDSVDCNPLFIVGWSGLIMNSINLIPVGELDGGKLSLALFGRQGSQLLSLISFVALGVGSFVDGLAFFWLLLVLSIQRGPDFPCLEEISTPDAQTKSYALALLFVPLIVLLPYPTGN